MIDAILLSLLFAVATPQPATSASGVIEVTLPDAQTAPAPNIHLKHFEYASAGDPNTNAVDYDQMMRLEEAIKKAAASTLAHSQAHFGVRASYSLYPDQPAAFRMQVAGDTHSEAAQIKQFYDKASALKEFHCKSGNVFITFDYRISPVAAGHR